MRKKPAETIVVRKTIKKGHGSHGGSWKIAYADFMTAMMAFFLVMWLLSSSSPEQRQQIAEYFKVPLKNTLANGPNASLSDSMIPGGGDDALKQDGEVFKKTLQKLDAKKSEANLKRAREKMENLIEVDPRLNNFTSNLRLSLTDDGLLLQITDSADRPMFKVGRPTPESYMVNILQALVPVLNDMSNRIILTGHTDSLPYANGEQGYSNWELSSDRANASRRILAAAGLASKKFIRVVGTADTMMQAGSDAGDPINRRISILVLSQQKEKQIMQEDVLLRDTLVPTPVSQSASANNAARPTPGAVAAETRVNSAPEEIK